MVIILHCTILAAFGERAKTIYIRAVDTDGPEVSLSDIEEKLSSVESSVDFSYKSLLMQVKKSCFRPERLIFIDNESEPEKVAQYFQVL